MIQGKWFPPGNTIEDALRVREMVFVEEQGFSRALERDDKDDISWHVVLYQAGDPVATARIYYEDGAYHIGRICVLARCRGQGLGDLLMRLLLDKARRHFAPVVVLGAQLQAAPFYAKYGFRQDGEPYEEEGVPHIPMSLPGDQIDLSGTCEKQECGDCPMGEECKERQ